MALEAAGRRRQLGPMRFRPCNRSLEVRASARRKEKEEEEVGINPLHWESLTPAAATALSLSLVRALHVT